MQLPDRHDRSVPSRLARLGLLLCLAATIGLVPAPALADDASEALREGREEADSAREGRLRAVLDSAAFFGGERVVLARSADGLERSAPILRERTDVRGGLRLRHERGNWAVNLAGERYIAREDWGLSSGEESPGLVKFWRYSIGLDYTFR